MYIEPLHSKFTIPTFKSVPKIRIQGVKYQQKTAKNNLFTPKTQI